MPNKENIDAFWDIEDLIPKRPKKILQSLRIRTSLRKKSF